MANLSSRETFKLTTPATYRIRIQGRLDSNWVDRVGGMAVTVEPSANQPGISTLVGYLPDQAALSGVLNTLYDLHLPLLSVENLDESSA